MSPADSTPILRNRLRARPGRADLLHALDQRDTPGLAEMAEMLGYEKASKRVATPGSSSVGADADPLVIAPDAKLQRIPFWRLETYQDIPAKDAKPKVAKPARPLTAQSLRRLPGTRRAAEPIVADAAVYTAFDRMLDARRPSRRIDVDAVIEALARGRELAELPRLHSAGWNPRLVLLVDRSQRLIPFWQDQDRVVRDLIARLGAHAVRIWGWIDGGQAWRNRLGERAALPPVDEEEAVLALSDLGFYGDADTRTRWAVWGRRLRAKAASMAALVPCPRDRWQSGMARVWHAVDWSAPNRRGHGGARDLSSDRDPGGVDLLLTLVSVATRIEPGLLRDIRHLIPNHTSLATEADAWAHPDLARFSSVAGQLDTAAQRRRRAAFRLQPRALKEQVVRAVRAWRAGMREEVWWEEVFALLGDGELEDVLADDLDQAAAFVKQLAATAKGAGHGEFRERTLHWVRRFGPRLGKHAWIDHEVGEALGDAWRAAWEGFEHVPLPAGMGPSMFAPGTGAERAWTLGQVDSEIVFEPGEYQGSPLGTVIAAEASIKIGDDLVPALTLRPGRTESLPASPTLILRTDRSEATLRQITRPRWANAMGRDRFGLWASFEVAGIKQRMRWIPPGRYWMGSPPEEPGRFDWEMTRHLEVIEHGFWLGDTPCTQALWQAVMGENPSEFKGEELPVEKVSWQDCERFLATVNDLAADRDDLLRLPLEVEWEYACRAGTETATYAGTFESDDQSKAQELDAIAWYGHNSDGETHAVAQKAPNPWGLYDMLGNVWEWCQDYWRSDYDSKPQGTARVIRGGSWISHAQDVRAAFRYHGEPSHRDGILGFRLVRGQSALQSAEPQAGRAEPAGAERPPEGARRGTRRRSLPSRPEAAGK